MTSTTLDVNGTRLHLEEHGDPAAPPVLLLHGWPDTADVWRHQVPALVAAGRRVLAPDLRGMGRSQLDPETRHYVMSNLVTDVARVLDECGVGRTAVVGHDWGAALAWAFAIRRPERVDRLAVLSVAHPLAPATLRQAELGWYQLFFQFRDIAEATIRHDDWAWLREFSRGDGDLDAAIANLSRPGALTASLNWYRANVAPRPPGPPLELPQVTAPTLALWSTGDHYLDGARMVASERFVDAPWRYEQIEGASHWLQLDAADRVTELLLEWLAGDPS